MALPRVISEEEQSMYYLGLPSSPRLVARSSTAPWVMRRDNWPGMWSSPCRKMLLNVGDHPIVDGWNNSNVLRQRIMDVLSRHEAEWHSIDILRIGYQEDEPSQFPVVLFVNIEPGSMTWERAHSIVCQCKLILEHHGLEGVECEVKESRLIKLGPPNVLQLEPGAYPYVFNCLHPFADYIGTSIAAIDQRSVEGTQGVLLRDTSDTDTIYALTCRHVCYGDNETGELLPTTRPAAATANPLPSKAMIQPGNTKFKAERETLQGYRDNVADQHMKLLQRAIMEEGRQQARLEALQTQVQEADSALALIKDREEPETRVFGTVAYARGYGIRDHGQLSDWCLIRLDPTRFQRPISQLKSRVVIDQGTGLPNMILQGELDSGVLTLSDVVPASEFTKQAGTSTTILGKRGRSTKLSFGHVNQVKSIVRHPSKGRPHLTAVEWCIVSVKGTRGSVFSEPGDSGSCVWDMKGHVAAMITAGITRDEILKGDDNYGLDIAVDVTYVTPMEWLFDDFRACGLQLEIL